VITLSVVASVLLVVLLISGLAMVEGRARGHRDDLALAREQAQWAMGRALGELQRLAGPDQRVTGTAELLDAVPETGEIEGVAQPSWTGVWASTWDDPSSDEVEAGLIIFRDLGSQSLVDRRASEPVGEPGWKAERALSWLVSGNEGRGSGDPGRHDPRSVDVGSHGMVRLVSARAGEHGEVPAVWAPAVELASGEGRGSGVLRYAYWVGDEGVKARVGGAHPDRHAQPGGVGGAAGYRRMVAAAGAGRGVGEGWPEWDAGEHNRLVTPEQLLLVGAGEGLDQGWVRSKFHDITGVGHGVLADVREGGLKRDLTAYFLSDGQVDGLGDRDRLVGPMTVEEAGGEIAWQANRHRDSSPRFGVLRDWAKREVAIEGGRTGLALGNHYHGDTEDLWGWDYTNDVMHNWDDLSKTGINPILVEASVYYGISRRTVEGQERLRLHLYPRVVVWNPYNVEIEARPYALLLFVLGSQGLNLRLANGTSKIAHFLLPNTTRPGEFVSSVSEGTMIFTLEPIALGPGECLLYSVAGGDAGAVARPYDMLNYARNTLSASAPATTSNFTIDGCFFEGDWNAAHVPLALPARAEAFTFRRSRSHGYLTVFKDVGEGAIPASLNMEQARDLPELQGIYMSYKGNAGHNWHPAWNNLLEVPIDGNQTAKPSYKTRDGYRLRWFRESDSNLLHWNPMRHLDSAPVASYNMQGSFMARTPRETMSWTEPEMFGIYTRDLWDDDIDWDNLAPIPLAGGKWGDNPFAAAQDWALERYVLFDLPRREAGILSLGQLAHAKTSEFIWHPSYAIGNSFACPRSPRDGSCYDQSTNFSQWGASAYHNDSYFARCFRAIAHQSVEKVLVYDQSYELNHSLWDRYFLSTGDRSEKRALAEDGVGTRLPNARMRPNPHAPGGITEEGLSDFRVAASQLLVEGAFNVNSTRREAWAMVLGSNRGLRPRSSGADDVEGRTPFPRILDPIEGEYGLEEGSTGAGAWAGFRSLSDVEIDVLAGQLVAEVKRRGPFLSMGDFVNRRLRRDDTGLMGALQAAIDAAGLNDGFGDYPIDRTPVPQRVVGTPIHNLLQEHQPGHKAAGAPGYLMQSDILQALGPVLAARSDSFRIRSYGEVRGVGGEVRAKAYLETLVQRVPEPVRAGEEGLDPDPGEAIDLGRRFVILSRRWLSEDEL